MKIVTALSENWNLLLLLIRNKVRKERENKIMTVVFEGKTKRANIPYMRVIQGVAYNLAHVTRISDNCFSFKVAIP